MIFYLYLFYLNSYNYDIIKWWKIIKWFENLMIFVRDVLLEAIVIEKYYDIYDILLIKEENKKKK